MSASSDNLAYLFEAKGIQRYILDSGRLADLIGASDLIADLCSSDGNDLLAEVQQATRTDDLKLSRRAGGAFCMHGQDRNRLDRLRALWRLAVGLRVPGMPFTDTGNQAGSDDVQAMGAAYRAQPGLRENDAAFLPPTGGPMTAINPRTGRIATHLERKGGDRIFHDAITATQRARADRLGEVAPKLDLALDEGNRSAAGLLDTFTGYMDAICKEWGGPGWADSKQIKALLKAADPAQNDPDELEYMELGDPRRPVDGTYIGEKRRQGFLPDYVDGHEFDRPNPPPGGTAGSPPQPEPRDNGDREQPERPPVKGARVRFHEKASKEIAGKEGVIIQAGSGDFARHRIKLNNGKVVSWPKSMFTVLAGSD